MAKKSRQGFKYLETEDLKTFKMKQKAFLISFEGLSLSQIKHFFGR